MKKLTILFVFLSSSILIFAKHSELKVGDSFEYRIEDYTTFKIRSQEITVKDKKSSKPSMPDRYFDVYIVADLNFEVIENDISSAIIEVKPSYFSYYSNEHTTGKRIASNMIRFNSEIQKPGPYVSLYYPMFTKEAFKIRVQKSKIEYPAPSYDELQRNSSSSFVTILGKEQTLLEPILSMLFHNDSIPLISNGFKYKKDTSNDYHCYEVFLPSEEIKGKLLFRKNEKLPYKYIVKSYGNNLEKKNRYQNTVIKKIERNSSSFKTKYNPDNFNLRNPVDTIISKPNTCITGIVNNKKKNVIIQISGSDYIENCKQVYHVQCDENGKFLLKIDINEPAEFFIDWKYHGILVPGDSLMCKENTGGNISFEGIDSNNSIFYNEYLNLANQFRVNKEPLTHFFDSTQYIVTPSVWLKAYNDYRYLKFNIDFSKPNTNKIDTLDHFIDLDDDQLASSKFYTQEGIEKLDIWGKNQIQRQKERKGFFYKKNDDGFEVYSYITLNFSGLTECLLKYNWVKYTWQNELDHKKAEMIAKRFLEEYPNSKYSKGIEHFIGKYDNLKKGNKIPEFELKNIDGNTVKLSDYKGKTIYLLFWSFSESILTSDFKNYNSILRALEKKENVKVLLVNRNNKASQAGSNFIRDNLTDFENFNLHEGSVKYKEIASALKISSLPRAVIFDKNGDIFNYYAPLFIFSKDLNNEIEEALKISTKTKALLKKLSMFIPLFVIILLVIFITFYIRKTRKLKFNKQLNEVKLKAIRSQMNPHFVFNALNSIQGLVNTNKKEEANLYLSKFATLLRNVLENSEQTFISLEEELEAVTTYCELEKMRVDFNYELIVDPAIKTNEVEISGMLIQPLIENAIAHGLAHKTTNRQLTLSIHQKDNYLIIIVADNGKGIPPNEIDKLREKGFGLKLVEERIHLLELEKKKSYLKILPYGIDKKQGTTVKLVFPIN